jgi:hypothetical protein
MFVCYAFVSSVINLIYSRKLVLLHFGWMSWRRWACQIIPFTNGVICTLPSNQNVKLVFSAFGINKDKNYAKHSHTHTHTHTTQTHTPKNRYDWRLRQLKWPCCDTQHSDIQHNNTTHNDIQHNNKYNMTLSSFAFSIVVEFCYAECLYAKCLYAEFCYAECLYAECP